MKNKKKILGPVLTAFLVAIAILANMHLVSAYMPQKGDYFGYSETTTVDNGQGSYTGYSDQLKTTGMEQMNSVNGNLVSGFYSYSYQYSNNQGSSTSSSSSGNYTWSSGTFTYVNGTDNQAGFGGNRYSKPLYVWFTMNRSLSVGSTFYVLNTQFTIMSKNYSLQLPAENKYVQTIQAKGTGQYQRNDSYGVFTVSYTWFEYFEPSTGYVVGYNYLEQDDGQYQGQAGGFTYADDLYVTSTSYPLTAVSAPLSNQGATGGFPGFLGYLGIALVVLFIASIAIYAVTRRRSKDSLPNGTHTPYPPPPISPSSTPFQSKIDLGSKPPEQVVIRDVAKVNCKYCGTLIPSTADRCPYCGGPRQ